MALSDIDGEALLDEPNESQDGADNEPATSGEQPEGDKGTSDDSGAETDLPDGGGGDAETPEPRQPEPEAPKPEEDTGDDLDAQLDAAVEKIPGEWDKQTKEAFKAIAKLSATLGEERGYKRVKTDEQAAEAEEKANRELADTWHQQAGELSKDGRMPAPEDPKYEARMRQVFDVMQEAQTLNFKTALAYLESKERQDEARKTQDQAKSRIGGLVGGGVNNKSASSTRAPIAPGSRSIADAAEAAFQELGI